MLMMITASLKIPATHLDAPFKLPEETNNFRDGGGCDSKVTSELQLTSLPSHIRAQSYVSIRTLRAQSKCMAKTMHELLHIEVDW
jgi:hypothetical protein